MPGVCLGSTSEFKELSCTLARWSLVLFSAGAFILFMQMEQLSSRGAVPSVYATQHAVRRASSQLQVLCWNHILSAP